MSDNKEMKNGGAMGFEEIQQQVQRVQKIKIGITIITLIAMVVCTIVFWDASDKYLIQLEGDKNEGFEWSYTLSEEGIIKEVSESYGDGMFQFEFQGVGKGKAEIYFSCIKDGDNANPVKETTYSVRVDKEMNIINKVIYQ